MCDAKGDMSSALILEMFECVIELNGFTAELHHFIFPFSQPWRTHEFRWFKLDLDQARMWIWIWIKLGVGLDSFLQWIARWIQSSVFSPGPDLKEIRSDGAARWTGPMRFAGSRCRCPFLFGSLYNFGVSEMRPYVAILAQYRCVPVHTGRRDIEVKYIIFTS